MRVLHVSQPVEAGVPNVVISLATDQVARGYDVHVACPPGPGLTDRAVAVGASVHSWPAGREPGRSVPGEARRLGRIIEDVNPDIVVLHSAKAGLAGRLVSGDRPTVFVPHAWSFEAVHGVMGQLSKTWEIYAGRNTDVVVCVSDDERRRGEVAGVAARMAVVPNGVDVEARHPHPAAPARARLALPDRPTVVCVGRLAEQKGQDLLLQAWPLVVATVPDAHLVLVGDGPRRAALEATAPTGVQFVGARSDVDDFLAAADVVALPSRWESTPLISLEAMAAARPVVAFEVDGLRAAMGDTGVILDQGDIAGMARALSALLLDPAAAAAAGEAARERIVEVGDLRNGTKAWDEILTELVSSAAPQPEPLRVVPAGKLLKQLAAGALRRADVVTVTGHGPLDKVRAGALSALGVPVWWKNAGSAAVPALGAPVVVGDVSVDALSLAARRPGAGSIEGPAVSVIVTCLNEGDDLRRLVDLLLHQLRDGDEIVIVDGGSTDGSVETLTADSQLRVEISPGAGISAGRNIGIRMAANEVIICTDAGCTPHPGFIDGFRRAFAVAEMPALVSGVFVSEARNAMERAQALACYPQLDEVRRPTLALRLYARAFGTGYDPRYSVGRCVAFTREAWARVGGFPEDMATGEDTTFGLRISKFADCVATTDAVVDWGQRDGLASTWRMYRGYGRASTNGGDIRMFARDAARALAYVAVPVMMTTPLGRKLSAVGAGAYLSVPLVRTIKARAGFATAAALPVALATKDLGKVTGAIQGLQARRRARSK